MKERPILFSAPMVRALLAGSKTQTRRVMKTQVIGEVLEMAMAPGSGPLWNKWAIRTDRGVTEIKCPYGKTGDRLWVRETWRVGVAHDKLKPSELPSNLLVQYMANRENEDLFAWAKGRPSIFMPRWASRITLEITDVRVQRLHDISEEDATAEGLDLSHLNLDVANQFDRPMRYEYKRLWESINGAGSWDLNPWVWALTFRRVAP